MDIEAYLRRQHDQFGRSARHVKGFAVFDCNYVPDQPLMRDECKRRIDALFRFACALYFRAHGRLFVSGSTNR